MQRSAGRIAAGYSAIVRPRNAARPHRTDSLPPPPEAPQNPACTAKPQRGNRVRTSGTVPLSDSSRPEGASHRPAAQPAVPATAPHRPSDPAPAPCRDAANRFCGARTTCLPRRPTFLHGSPATARAPAKPGCGRDGGHPARRHAPAPSASTWPPRRTRNEIQTGGAAKRRTGRAYRHRTERRFRTEPAAAAPRQRAVPETHASLPKHRPA